MAITPSLAQPTDTAYRAMTDCAMSFSTAQLRQLSPVLEKANLNTSRSRPGYFHLLCWSRGRPAALEMTVISSLQSSTLQSAGTSAGHALELSDERKFTKHLSAREEDGISFVPLSVETLGGWSPIAAKTICRIASTAAARSACANPGSSCLLSYATAVSCPAKRELHPPPVPVLLMSVFFSVLCKSGNVFLCIWHHCKFVSVILYVWHFVSPRVNAKLLNLSPFSLNIQHENKLFPKNSLVAGLSNQFF